MVMMMGVGKSGDPICAVAQRREEIVSGKLNAKDHIMRLLGVIEEDKRKGDKGVNALLHVNPDAVQQAAAVDEKRAAQKKLGRLAGLAIAVKSNIAVEGMESSCASKTLEGWISPYDADVIARIRAEDGIIIGMANMDEFACGASGETSAFGKTDNPAAPGRVPGGSSSGSAAAVAAGMCDLALGSDTGGSIRNPASHCGVVGIKPQYGRVSRHGLIDLAMSFDQIGPLAPDVASAAVLLEVISGHSPNDPTTIAAKVPDLSCSASSSKLVVGIAPQLSKLCTDMRIWDHVMAAGKEACSVTGWKCVDVDLPYLDLAIQTYYPIVYVEFFSGTRKFDGRKYGLKIEDAVGPEVLRRIFGGQEMSKAEHAGRYYRRSLQAKAAITQAIDAAFKKVDVLLLPTTPKLPHNFGESLSVEEMYGYDAFTTPANIAGIAAGVVPVGKIDGVPVGIQVFARDEKKLVEMMVALERHHQAVSGKP